MVNRGLNRLRVECDAVPLRAKIAFYVEHRRDVGEDHTFGCGLRGQRYLEQCGQQAQRTEGSRAKHEVHGRFRERLHSYLCGLGGLKIRMTEIGVRSHRGRFLVLVT